MATMKITLSVAAMAAKPKGATFTGTISLPAVETRPIRIDSATFHGKYVRVYNKYCYLSFACGTSTGATAVFESTDGSAKVRDAAVTFTKAGNLLAVNGQTITFTIQSSNASWSGNFFDIYNPQEFYIDVTYTVLESPSTFTLDKTTLDAGTAITPIITAGVGAARHKIVWQFGSNSASQSTNAAFTVPLSWLNAIPSALSGAASATLTTYNSAGAQIGSPQTIYFTVTCPTSVLPTFTSVTAAGIGQSFSLYLKGRSSVKLTINGAKGIYSSTIARYQISGGGFSGTAATLTTGIFSAAGSITFTATIWDTRGRSATRTVPITVTNYNPPAINSATQQRCNASSVIDRKGTYAKCAVSYTFSKVSTNAISLKIEYKRADLAAWTSAYTGTPASGAALTIGSGKLLGANSWDIRYTLSDSLQSVTATYRIGTAGVFLHLKSGGGGIGVGALCEANKRVQIANDWNMIYKGRELCDLIYPVGSIYLSTSTTNPSTLWGGTWGAYAQGRVLVGVSTSTTDYASAGKSGGAATVSHTHTVNGHTHWVNDMTLAVGQIPSHNHTATGSYWGDGNTTYPSNWGFANGSGRNFYVSKPTLNVGGSGSHNHGSTGSTAPATSSNGVDVRQPYITCYIWRRTA